MGKATVEGTMAFIAESNLPFYHKFEGCGLYINPIIHGAPKEPCWADDDFITFLTHRGIRINRSNATVVYEHHGQKVWSGKYLAKILEEGHGIERDQIVTIANLGLASSKSEMSRRLEEAKNLSGLASIDIAMFKVSSASTRLAYCTPIPLLY